MSKRRTKMRQADRRRRQAERGEAGGRRSEIPTSDRDSSGRFAAGNQAARGPRVARPSTSYARRLREAIHPDELAEVGQTLLGLARAGDIKAARLLFTYLLPAPAQHISIDQHFGDPDTTLTTEFRRAGASASQIDREFGEYLAGLVAEQAEYEAALAAHMETPR